MGLCGEMEPISVFTSATPDSDSADHLERHHGTSSDEWLPHLRLCEQVRDGRRIERVSEPLGADPSAYGEPLPLNPGVSR